MTEENIKEVMKTLETYFEGNKELDAQKILSAWDSDLKIISTEKTVGPEGWIQMEEEYRKEINNDMNKWDIEFEIKSKDVFRNCASLRVDVKYRIGERKFGETQFLHLLKKEDIWLIYSKIFTFYPLDW
ncbi:MAG: nuclear transport factor 2 family protein [Candidatus Heimdallarchaeota archaeon]